MNRWGRAPVARPQGQSGWIVVFGIRTNGQMPALAYIQHELTDAEQGRLLGLFDHLAQNGPRALRSKRQFKEFSGAEQGMLEFKVGGNCGRRILGFYDRLPHPVDGGDPIPTIVLAHGFDKEPQLETEQSDKNAAQGVWVEHRARFASIKKGGRRT